MLEVSKDTDNNFFSDSKLDAKDEHNNSQDNANGDEDIYQEVNGPLPSFEQTTRHQYNLLGFKTYRTVEASPGDSFRMKTSVNFESAEKDCEKIEEDSKKKIDSYWKEHTEEAKVLSKFYGFQKESPDKNHRETSRTCGYVAWDEGKQNNSGADEIYDIQKRRKYEDAESSNTISKKFHDEHRREEWTWNRVIDNRLKKFDRIAKNNQMKMAGYPHVVNWNKERKEALKDGVLLVDHLIFEIQEKKIELDGYVNKITKFFEYFITTFKNSNNRLYEKLLKSKENFGKSKTSEVFDFIMDNVIQAEKIKNEKCETYKNLQTETGEAYYYLKDNLRKGKNHQELEKLLKQARETRLVLINYGINTLDDWTKFQKVFQENKTLNDNKNASKSDVAWYCFKFASEVKELAITVSKYADTGLNLLEKIQTIEVDYVSSIMDSLKRLCLQNETYFSQEINSDYLGVIQDIESAMNEKTALQTFFLGNIFSETQKEKIMKKSNLSVFETKDDLKIYFSCINSGQEIWNQFIRLKSKVRYVTYLEGEVSPKSPEAETELSNQYFSFDDYISLIPHNSVNGLLFPIKKVINYKICKQESQRNTILPNELTSENINYPSIERLVDNHAVVHHPNSSESSKKKSEEYILIKFNNQNKWFKKVSNVKIWFYKADEMSAFEYLLLEAHQYYKKH